MDEIIDQPDLPEKIDRPGSVTYTCLLGFTGSLGYFIYFLINWNLFEPWVPLFMMICLAGWSVAFAGLWYMNKWGTYLYIIIFILHELLFITLEYWVVTIIISVLPLIVIERNVKLMK